MSPPLWRGPGNGGHDDKAHPPIHPTRALTQQGGEGNWTADHAVSRAAGVKVAEERECQGGNERV